MDFVCKLYGNTYCVHVTVALVGVATLNLALPPPPRLFEKFSAFLDLATKRAANSEKKSNFADDYIFVVLEDKVSPLSCQKLVETWCAIGLGNIFGADL